MEALFSPLVTIAIAPPSVDLRCFLRIELAGLVLDLLCSLEQEAQTMKVFLMAEIRFRQQNEVRLR